MKVTVKFFGNYREKFQIDEQDFDSHLSTVTPSHIWNEIAKIDTPSNLLVAVNHTYSQLDHELCEGDEVAFFPPVTGG